MIAARKISLAIWFHVRNSGHMNICFRCLDMTVKMHGLIIVPSASRGTTAGAHFT